MKCERKVEKKKCPNVATEFVMGQNVCVMHDTAGASNCSHSLAVAGRCAHCGART